MGVDENDEKNYDASDDACEAVLKSVGADYVGTRDTDRTTLSVAIMANSLLPANSKKPAAWGGRLRLRQRGRPGSL